MSARIQITPSAWVDDWCDYYSNDYTKVKGFMDDYFSSSPRINQAWIDYAYFWLDCRIEMAWLD